MSRQVPHLRAWKGGPSRIVIDGVEPPVTDWEITSGDGLGLVDVTVRLKAELADEDPQPASPHGTPPDAPLIMVNVSGSLVTTKQLADAAAAQLRRGRRNANIDGKHKR